MFSFLYHCHDFYRTWLYIWVTRRVSYKKQELPTLRKHLSSSPVFSVGSVLLIFLAFCVVPIMCLYVLVCRSAHVLFTLFVFACALWCPTHIVFCFCFVFLRLVYPMLPVSLDCPYLIAPSVFSSVYFTYCSEPNTPWIDFSVIIWGTYFWFHQKRTTCFEKSESLKIIKY
jgi:hypothetical protein